jgi:hypothetical protein
MSIRVDQEILNQKGTPAFNAANYASRPAAGFLGRIFISTDTYQIYRDEGTGWSLIADAGSGSGNLQSVTFNGNTTTYGINIQGGATLSINGLVSGGILFSDGISGVVTQDATTLFWDNTNKRLGLGTATPGVRLDVHSSSGINATFNGTGVTNAVTSYQSAGTSKWSIGNYVSSAVANDFCIYDNVNTTYRLYVHNTGVINIPTSLIIGSTTPTTSYALDVTGSGNFTSSLLIGTTITGNSFIPNGSTVPSNGMYLSAANTLAFATNSTNKLTIASTGLASFNYNTSGTALKITTSYASGRVANFGFGDGTILPTAAFYIGNQTGVGVFIGDETATKGLYVTSGGISILNYQSPVGTNFSPQLQAKGGATGSSGSGFGIISSNNEMAGGIGLSSSASNSLQITADPDNLRASSEIGFTIDNSRYMTIASSGNVLIGTTTDSGSKFSVLGEGNFGNPLSGAAQILIGLSTGPYIKMNGPVSSNTFGSSSNLYIFDATNARGNGFQNNASQNLCIFHYNSGWANIGSFNNSTGIYTPVSDINKKKDFELSTIGLNAILGLKPTLYRMKTQDNTEKHLGFIAQEVNEFIPQAYINDNDFIGLDYQAITATIVKAIQELNEKLVRNNIN